MDSTSYNASCNCEMRLDEDEDGADVGDDFDDDLDDARDDGNDDGDGLPFREVISSAESARRRALFFSVGFLHGAAAELSKNSFLGFLGDEEYIGQRGEPGVAPGLQAPSRRSQGWDRARWPPGAPVAPLWSLFHVSSLIFRKIPSVDFQVIWRYSCSATQRSLFTVESCVCCF